MGKLIVFTSSKGGAGGSVCAAGIATAAATLDKKTLIIDMASKGRCLDTLFATTAKTVFDFCDVANGKVEISSAAVKCDIFENLSVLASSVNDSKITDDGLINLINLAVNNYDYVFIDANWEVFLKINSLCAFAQFVIVTSPELIALKNVYEVSSNLQKLSNTKFILNFFDKKDKLCSSLDNIVDTCGVSLLGVVPKDKQVKICYDSCTPIIFGRASKAFMRIFSRLNSNFVSLPKINRI